MYIIYNWGLAIFSRPTSERIKKSSQTSLLHFVKTKKT